SAPANGGTAWATTIVPNVVGGGVLPAGGTWRCFFLNSDKDDFLVRDLAGGSVFSNIVDGQINSKYKAVLAIRVA
ncbi:hypothetical protein, partial [Bilophila wadsworthia]